MLIRLWNLLRYRRLDREMDVELRHHLESLESEYRARGLSAEAARLAARRDFGGVAQTREAHREQRGLPPLIDALTRDLVIAARNVARSPVVSLGVVLTLGLGIGATTTIYAVVDGVMLRRLPYTEPSTLVAVGTLSPTGAFLAPGVHDLGPISILHYQQLRQRARSFDTLVAVNVERLMPLASPDGGETNVRAHEISRGLFEMLGATTPTLGRLFVPEEYQTPEEGAVMVTFEEWQRRYGGDRSIIGRTIGRIRGGRFPAVVVGVLPPDFQPLEALFASGETPGYYFPRAPELLAEDRGGEPWYVLGRLKPGVAIEQARAEIERIAGDVAREFPEVVGVRQRGGTPSRLGLNGLQAQTVGANAQVLRVFLGAAALLLALAVMNAAALLLARSLDRAKEFGIRMALGAGRMRVVRLIVCETALLAAGGGVVGVLIAQSGVDAFLRLAPTSIPRLNAITLDARVLAVSALTSIAAGLLIGLLPALGLTRRGPWRPLQADARAFAAPSSGVRSVLVAGQMAAAIVLLASAGLLFNSFVRMRAVDPGIDVDRLVTVTVAYKDAPAVRRLPLPQAWDRVLDELGTVPGVQSAAGTTTAPFQTPFWSVRTQLRDDAPDTWHGSVAAYAITPEYLETVGTRLRLGRNVDRNDGPGSERVAIVNESFARTRFPGHDPLGSVVRLSDGGDPVRIIGVVEDVIQRRAEEGFRPALYVPYTQQRGTPFIVAVIRTTLPPETLVHDLRAVTSRLVPGRQPDIRIMRDEVAATLTAPQFRAMLIGAFGLVATLLGSIGLYAAMAHFVERRRRELGIRIALGGNRRHVVGLVLGRGLGLSLTGLIVGLLATVALSRTLRGFLYGVEPHDPTTLIGAAAVLVLVSVAACVVPAGRATVVDPVAVLKAE
jgi:putative ABC transport system permease protein